LEVKGAVVVGKLKESKDVKFGFNADTEEYGDLLADGVRLHRYGQHPGDRW
jgi:chaperonin GroEL